MSLPYDETLSGSPWGRLREAAASRMALIEITALSFAVIVFVVSVLPNLANHPTLTDDEAWVMSASYKLATQGVFGSDLFRGFYNADQHYFFNMPGQHFVLAAAFKVFGAGVAQARLVGVVYGLATLGLTYAFARRLYGAAAAVLTLALLLFLRLNMGFDTGLPLQELAASVRYDLAPAPFMLAGVLLLLGALPRGSAPGEARGSGTGEAAGSGTAEVRGLGTDEREASRGDARDAYRGYLWRAAAAGALFGIATLLQFYGAFIIPVAVAFLALESLPAKDRARLAGALVGTAALVCLPYVVFALAHYDDFRGQAGTVDRRDDFGSPSFYVDSLVHEPDRFLRPLAFKEVPKGEDPRLVDPRFLSLSEIAVRRPSAKLGVLVGLPLAIVFAGWRAFRERSRGDRLLFLALAGLCLQFALFESLKLYIYWIAVVPFLCTGIAGAALWLLRPPREDRFRLAIAAATTLCLLLVLAEGSAARLSGLRTASSETDYAGLGNLIHESVPADSKVVGSTSLWWALRDTDYRSYFMFFYVTSPDAGPYRRGISDYLEEFQPEYLVLTRLGVEELQKHLSAGDLKELEDYKAAHAKLQRRIEGSDARSYGYVEIWQITPPSRRP